MLNCDIILPAIHFKWLRIVLFKKKHLETPPPKKNIPKRINTCLWTALVFHLILHVNICPLSELSSFVTNEWTISIEKYFCAVDFVKTQQRLYALVRCCVEMKKKKSVSMLRCFFFSFLFFKSAINVRLLAVH